MEWNIKDSIFSINKELGQNFLIDKNILKKIANSINVKNKDCVEIGGGIGNLTYFISQQSPKSLEVIEKDLFYCNQLNKQIENNFFPNPVKIIEGNCLNIPINTDIIFGNLPYYISKEILIKTILFDSYDQMLFLFQKEVGEKIVASFKTKKYSAISAFIQGTNCVKLLFGVPPSCFFPAPKVHSALVCFKNKNISFNIKNRLKKLVFGLFLNRRKKIKEVYFKNKRPEEISPEEYLKYIQVNLL